MEKFDKFTTEIKDSIAECLDVPSGSVVLLDDSISLGGSFEFVDSNGVIKVKTPSIVLCENKLNLLKNISNNFENISMNFYHYLHVKNVMGENYIDTPKSIVDSIIGYIEKRNSSDEYEFLLPFKNRINRFYDEDKKTLSDELIESFEYVISFSFHNNKNKFTYYITKIGKNGNSSIIKTNEIPNHQTRSFIESLMCYGNINI